MSIYFLDIDDCLIKTSSLSQDHLKVIEINLKKLGVSNSKKITDEFAVSFKRLYDHHQGKKLNSNNNKLLEEYIQQLNHLQKNILLKYGEVKRWSREICLYLAAKKYNIKLTNQQILTATNNLWTKISELAIFYPDALPFLRKLMDNNIPIYLITSSDSRLTLNENNGLFNYDPAYSRKLKMKRLQKFIDLGIPESHIFIGDPIDKPHPHIFRQALQIAEKSSPLKSPLLKLKFIMVGDSIKNDLLPAQQAGFNKFIYLNRQSRNPYNDRTDGIIEVNSLRHIRVPGI